MPPIEPSSPLAIVVMGVSGSGKTSVGEHLAARLGCAFVEGDRLHPEANVAKMAKGIPLTDDDRWPWLDLVGNELATARGRGESVVVSCSALKQTYRDRLRREAGGTLYFVFLTGDPKVLEQRMGARTGHFMPTSLLQSQLATLESPEHEAGVITVDVDASVDTIVSKAFDGITRLI
ncbi:MULTISPECIES: gluconokinase [unclassified Neorhizobium]|uniref:gluconokinase n=1 Tax=unclassified Neorhizobium TaxID=2629175 RepID=UPI001FF6A190|nr:MULTISPECIES: gluconokinase [unclassified Neorhizobium]MCJ9671056.1 gluconokinase [Neorhizobium sp. SHOUNA12B]MCJ9744740.1 gluconokinase [Neorhizobium sp. SHOUNA12A]